jgi:hypothetical protein
VEIVVYQRGGVLGLDRRYVVKDGTIEVIDKGRSRGLTELDPQQAARIDELAGYAAGADTESKELPVSDGMETKVQIRRDADSRSLELQTGDEAPPEVWDLIGEVSRASGA